MSKNNFLQIPKNVDDEGKKLSTKHADLCSHFNSLIEKEINNPLGKIKSRLQDIRLLTRGIINEAGLPPIAITPATAFDELPDIQAPGTGSGPRSNS